MGRMGLMGGMGWMGDLGDLGDLGDWGGYYLFLLNDFTFLFFFLTFAIRIALMGIMSCA